MAETAPRPFTTIDPHEAVVGIPDEKLGKLSELVKPEKTVPATVTFIDIAGLVKGAHQGEGLGNQFLGKIREVDAIVHVVRAFTNPEVSHQNPSGQPGSGDQILEDIEIVNLELELGGIKEKPTIYVLNSDESEVKDVSMIRIIDTVKQKFGGEALAISAKLEEEFIDLEPEERKEYLKELEVEEGGLNRLIKKAYQLLDLITFYTIKGGKELHAWSLKEGKTALDAAGEVHTDFAKNFIKAEVINVNELLALGEWKEAKEKGKVRLEGRDYVVQDEDVIEFKVGA